MQKLKKGKNVLGVYQLTAEWRENILFVWGGIYGFRLIFRSKYSTSEQDVQYVQLYIDSEMINCGYRTDRQVNLHVKCFYL
jgi:alanyl-tRNA synthetase